MTDTPKLDDKKLEDNYFFNLQDAGKPSSGVYADDEERLRAEGIRAVVENREPDYDNPPAVAGTPLVTEREINQVISGGSLNAENLDDLDIEAVTTLPVDNSGETDFEKLLTKSSKSSKETVKETKETKSVLDDVE